MSSYLNLELDSVGKNPGFPLRPEVPLKCCEYDTLGMRQNYRLQGKAIFLSRQQLNLIRYLEHTLHPCVEQLSVDMGLQRKHLLDHLQVSCQAGNSVAETGVAVPAQEGVIGGTLVQHVLQDVVHHLAPRSCLNLQHLAASVQRCDPLPLLTNSILPVGWAIRGLDVSRANKVVNAADASDSVGPDVSAVRGEKTADEAKVLSAFKEQHQPIV